MTEIERKALELVNEVARSRQQVTWDCIDREFCLEEALCRAIERHESFRQEVSDAVVAFMMDKPGLSGAGITRFIITKPDPLEEIIKRNYAGSMSPPQIAYAIRKELDARGLEIREKSE